MNLNLKQIIFLANNYTYNTYLKRSKNILGKKIFQLREGAADQKRINRWLRYSISGQTVNNFYLNFT